VSKKKELFFVDVFEMYRNMVSKYGFNDGEAIPFYAEEYREVLVKLLNAALPEDYPSEAYAYDRPGIHNSCMILWRPKGSTPDQYGNYPVCSAPFFIEDLLRKIEESGVMDELLRVQVEVNPDADSVIHAWANRYKKKPQK
jgi:hypothetical protein